MHFHVERAGTLALNKAYIADPESPPLEAMTLPSITKLSEKFDTYPVYDPTGSMPNSDTLNAQE